MIYDVIVIGGGPGGYSAAEKAGAAGLETLCIEGRALGGTCLNEGCIPTKTLLYSAKQYMHALGASKYGVTAEHVKIDHSAVIDRKNKVVKTLVSGVGATLQANGVEVIPANGKITGKQAEGYVVEADGERYIGKNLIIATGSTCTVLPIPGLAEGLETGYVMTNREFLDMRELPESLAVRGGGVIGLEMATYAAMLGVKVTIIEMLDHIAGGTDQDLVKLLQKSCKKMGMLFELNAKVTEIRDHSVLYEKDGKSLEAAVDRVLLSIGRRPYTDNLGLENIGVATERGAVVTDEAMRTNVTDVYAVGDVNGKIMLAHKAYREADVAVNNILGKADAMQYDAVPAVLYTMPELSSVGETEQSAAEKDLNVQVIRMPMAYSGRYLVENEGGRGQMKLLIDRDTDTLVGAQFLCDYSSEFIAVCSTFIMQKLTVDEISRTIIPHPTVCEIIREALNQYTK